MNDPSFGNMNTEVASIIGNTEVKLGCSNIFSEQKIKVLYDLNGNEIEIPCKVLENSTSHDWNKDLVFKIPSPLTSDLISSYSNSSILLFNDYLSNKASSEIKEKETTFHSIISPLFEYQKTGKFSVYVDNQLFKTANITLYSPLLLEKLDLAVGKVNTSISGNLYGKKFVACQNIVYIS